MLSGPILGASHLWHGDCDLKAALVSESDTFHREVDCEDLSPQQRACGRLAALAIRIRFT